MKHMYSIYEIVDEVQHLGEFAGKKSVTIRFSGCNLRCQFCKNKEALSQTCCASMDTFEVISHCDGDFVTLSGNEPLYQKGLTNLVYAILDLDKKVTIETNGALDITPYAIDGVTIILSYKLPSSEMSNYMLLDNLDTMRTNDILRLHIASDKDIDFMKRIISYKTPKCKVCIIHEDHMCDKVALVAEELAQAGFDVITR